MTDAAAAAAAAAVAWLGPVLPAPFCRPRSAICDKAILPWMAKKGRRPSSERLIQSADYGMPCLIRQR